MPPNDDEYMFDQHAMDEEEAEELEQLEQDPVQQQQAEVLPKKKGGKQGKEAKKRVKKSRAAKLKDTREKLKAYKASIAAASNHPHSYALISQDDKLREAEGQEKEIDLSKMNPILLAELRSLADQSIGKSPAPAERRLDLTKVVNKPSTFDGTTGRFHEWKNEVQMYLRIMKFSPEQEASIVQGYLRGTALAWWIQKLDNMSANGIESPATYDEFMHHLNERFDHRNPELASRDKLMGLRQNNLTLHQYLREFEGCYAFIPKWDEADKIHRFMYGLKPYFRSKFSVDPATHKWWISFDALIAYISAYISDDVSGRADTGKQIHNLLDQTTGETPERRTPYKGNKSNRGFSQKQLSQVVMRAIHQTNKGRVQKPSAAVNQRPAPAVYANANGEPVTRSSAIRSWCHQEKRCLGCYRAGHLVAECTNAVARGAPYGYEAPSNK